jgi:hypothetical protein
MEKTITLSNLTGNARGLDGVYEMILDFIPCQCSLLLDITALPSLGVISRRAVDFNEEPVAGFDFLVNAVWPEVVSRLETQLQSVFAVGDPQAFHKNYLTSMQFVSSFERLCRNQATVDKLRSHSSYKSFMNRWSLPVYFQIRFQEIATQFEAVLESPFAVSNESGFLLNVTSVLWKCLHLCWSGSVFLVPLCHRFWKLSVQLVSRFTVWLREMTSTTQHEQITTDQLVQLTIDSNTLHNQLPSFFTDIVSSRLKGLTDDIQAFISGSAVAGLRDTLSAVIALLGDCVVERVCGLCMASLDEAKTIPRLYRHTNRDVPTKPSGFVTKVMSPLQSFLNTHSPVLPTQFRNDWTARCLNAVTDRFLAITGDVLTSVKKTEDSLLRLKRTRKSTGAATASGTPGITDDSKIRLQLSLDVEKYKQLMDEFDGHQTMDIAGLDQLLALGKAARTEASAQPQ